MRPDEEVGNAVKAFRFTLGEEATAGYVQSGEPSVFDRFADARDRQFEAVRHVLDGQSVSGRPHRGIRRAANGYYLYASRVG